MRILHIVLLTLAMWAGSAEAHRDSILQVKADGSIPDFPAAFGAMHLTVEGLGSSSPLIQLRIGAHLDTVPLCIARMIRSRDMAQIRVLASWYHDESKGLPYYVNIQFFEPGYDPMRSYNASQELLFNLHDAKLMNAKAFLANAKRNGEEIASSDSPRGCDLD